MLESMKYSAHINYYRMNLMFVAGQIGLKSILGNWSWISCKRKKSMAIHHEKKGISKIEDKKKKQ